MLTGAAAYSVTLCVQLFNGKLNSQQFGAFDTCSSSSDAIRRASATAAQLGSSRLDLTTTLL
jgi:hypothetical protein